MWKKIMLIPYIFKLSFKYEIKCTTKLKPLCLVFTVWSLIELTSYFLDKELSKHCFLSKT